MLAPYFNEHVRFQRSNVDRLLGPYTIRWREMMPPILEYATYSNFMHRSGRTVHEQILYRLGSRKRGVTYHDIVQGQVITYRTTDVRRDMLPAASALRALGIERGDRVAIVGLNCTRYLIIDVAIGLLGAVSVPLYYTSPPVDIIGAIVGGAIGLIGGPLAIATGALGAMIGGGVASLSDGGFPDEQLKIIGSSLRPGMSALVVLAKMTGAVDPESMIASFGAHSVKHAPLNRTLLSPQSAPDSRRADFFEMAAGATAVNLMGEIARDENQPPADPT